MNYRILTVFAVLASLLGSCTVMSFYPLFTESVLIRNDKILGQWTSFDKEMKQDTLCWEIRFEGKKKNVPFSEQANQYRYTLHVYHEDHPDEKAAFDLFLVQLGDQVYFDLYPEEWEMNNDIMAAHILPVHTFAKVDIGEEIVIRWFSSEWLHDLIENNKVRIRHEKNEEYILLTASPEDLQKFLLKYEDDPEAFNEDMTYVLSKETK